MAVELTDDLATAAVTHLSAQSEVTALLGSDATFDTWIFREDVLAVVEKSGAAAIVLRVQGGWAAPNVHNRMRFPRLITELYQDPPRDAGGNATQGRAQTLAQLDHLHKVVDSYLHRPQGGEQTWGDLRVIDCVRAGELEPFPWADVDATQVVRCNYNVVLG